MIKQRWTWSLCQIEFFVGAIFWAQWLHSFSTSKKSLHTQEWPVWTLVLWGTLISEPRSSTPRDMRFSYTTQGKCQFWSQSPKIGHFSVSRGKNRPAKALPDPRDLLSVKKGHINLRKIPGTPAGVPVSQGYPIVYEREIDRKGRLAPGAQAGCPRDSRPSRELSEIECVVSYVPYLLLVLKTSLARARRAWRPPETGTPSCKTVLQWFCKLHTLLSACEWILHRLSYTFIFQSRLLGRGCDEALFSEKKGFQWKGGR